MAAVASQVGVRAELGKDAATASEAPWTAAPLFKARLAASSLLTRPASTPQTPKGFAGETAQNRTGSHRSRKGYSLTDQRGIAGHDADRPASPSSGLWRAFDCEWAEEENRTTGRQDKAGCPAGGVMRLKLVCTLFLERLPTAL